MRAVELPVERASRDALNARWNSIRIRIYTKKCIKLFVEYSKKAYELYQFSSTAPNLPLPTPRWAPKEFQLVCNLQITTFDWLLIMRKIPTDQNSQRVLNMDWRERCTRRMLYFIFQGIF